MVLVIMIATVIMLAHLLIARTIIAFGAFVAISTIALFMAMVVKMIVTII